MKVCPYCGKKIPDDNNNIYCPFCNEIVDENVLLSMKIEEKLQKESPAKQKPVKEKKSEPVKKKIRYSDDDFDTVKLSDDKKPYAQIILLVLAVLAAIAYFLIK